MHYIVLYPQNGDRIVTIDSVTSLHPIYLLHTSKPVLSAQCDAHTQITHVTHVRENDARSFEGSRVKYVSVLGSNVAGCKLLFYLLITFNIQSWILS